MSARPGWFDLEVDHAICRRRADRRMVLRFGPLLHPDSNPTGVLLASCSTCLRTDDVHPHDDESLADFVQRAFAELFPTETTEENHVATNPTAGA